MNKEQFVEIAWEYFDNFGLTNDGWTFDINPNIYRLLGKCIYSNKVIVFSEKHIEQQNINENKSLILHEIAHALVGPNHGHDEVWQEKCLSIGGVPSATSSCCMRRTRAILA